MNHNYEVERYYVYKGNDYFDTTGYYDLDDAVDIAKENNCEEIEIHAWEKEELYKNYEPADLQMVVWRKGRYLL